MSENNNVKDDMIIGRVHKGQYRSLKDDLNLIVATKNQTKKLILKKTSLFPI